MSVKYNYKTSGVCSQNILITVNGDIIEEVQFIGGCPGNLLGIGKLVKGRTIDEVAELLAGISCGGKPSSCPDQLSRALKAISERQKNNK